MTASKKKPTSKATPKAALLPEMTAAAKSDWLLALIPAALFLAQAAFFLGASSFASSDYPLDDAWIHRVYAHSISRAEGFAYNPGEQEAGATSPLWAVVTAPAHWLEGFGTNAVTMAVKLGGILFALAALFFMQRIATTVTGSRIAGILTACVFLLEPRFVFSALSGMENILLFALTAWALHAMLSRRWMWASVAAGLMPVTRPEAILFLPLFAIFLFMMRSRHADAAKPLHLALMAIPTVLWILFCLSVNGHPLPNTFYLKAEPFQLHKAQVDAAWNILTQHGIASTMLFFAGLLTVGAWVLRRHRGLALWFIVFWIVFPLVFAFAVAGSRTLDQGGYYWTRWIDPASLMLSFAAATGMAVLLSSAFERAAYARIFPWLKERHWGCYAVSGAGLLLLAIFIPAIIKSMEDRRFHLWSDARAIHLVNVVAGEWIDRNLPRSATVGVNDAGAIRYFGKRHTIDLKGLNYADFAFGKVQPMQVIRKTDWLAVFPSWFQQADLFKYFEKRISFGIPLKEYTVCDCPGQTEKVIFEKKKEYR
jgi:hypothetical protein